MKLIRKEHATLFIQNVYGNLFLPYKLGTFLAIFRLLGKLILQQKNEDKFKSLITISHMDYQKRKKFNFSSKCN